MSLKFDENQYEIRTCELEGRKIRYRAFLNLDYCENPVDSIQLMNIFVPEIYYEGGKINGYSIDTAPMYMPIRMGGYLPGPADEPDYDYQGILNTIFTGLEHGYVILSAGVRGRSSGKNSSEFFIGGAKRQRPRLPKESEINTGKAPALIVDMKAAIRYVRANADKIPGDPEHIITNGTSAGGALSALTGTTGNSPDFESYLKEIGAADERDDIFAAVCYCPIQNLDHSDMGYEWMYQGMNDFHTMHFQFVDGKPIGEKVDGMMSPGQIEMSRELASMFPAYVNGLNIADETGCLLTLNEKGEGPFKEALMAKIIASAQNRLDHPGRYPLYDRFCAEGSEVLNQSYFTVENNRITAMDWDGYVRSLTRMKSTPAFDAVDLSAPENDEFGTEEDFARHFTDYSFRRSCVQGKMADPAIIKMMNPLNYVDNPSCAKYFRIRHGSYDRDTALAIQFILAMKLQQAGKNVDFELPWGIGHSGDYDQEEMFSWIDQIVKEDRRI